MSITLTSSGGIVAVNNALALGAITFAASGVNVTVTQVGNGTASTTIHPGNPIVPGAGFSGATEQPDAIGSGAGADKNVIGGWDVVPHQTFTTTMRVGAAVRHINGIARVDFIAEGGTPTSVTTRALNSDTGRVEFFGTLTASDFPDGPVELDAIAYPFVGVPRVLGRIFVNANSGGSLTTGIFKYCDYTNGNDTTGNGTLGNPYKTITQAMLSANTSGMTIYLLAGDHYMRGRSNEFPASGAQWCLVTAAPGVAKSAVRFFGKTGLTPDDSGVGCDKIRFKGITICELAVGTNSGTPSVWYDDCEMFNIGGPYFATGDPQPTQFIEFQFVNKYVTNSYLHDMPSIVDGVSLYRNCSVYRICGSGIHNCGMALGVTIVDSQTNGNTDIHPDICQFTQEAVNVYWEDITAVGTVDHPIDSFGVRLNNGCHDLAIVNCNLRVNASTVAGFGGDGTFINYYWLNNQLSPGWAMNDGGGFTAIDVVFEGNDFLGNTPPSGAGITIK